MIENEEHYHQITIMDNVNNLESKYIYFIEFIRNLKLYNIPRTMAEYNFDL